MQAKLQLHDNMEKPSRRQVLSKYVSRLLGSWEHTIPHEPKQDEAVLGVRSNIHGFPPAKKSELLKYLNEQSPIGAASRSMWKVKNTTYFDPQTKKIPRTCTILCCCEGSAPKQKPKAEPVRRRDTRSKQVGCRASIRVSWQDPESGFCVVTQMHLQHENHVDPRTCTSLTAEDSLVLDAADRENIIERFMESEGKMTRKVAQLVAQKNCGRSLSDDSVDYLMRKAKERIALADEEATLNTLANVAFDLDYEPSDIIASCSDSPSQKLVKQLRSLAVTKNLKYIVEYGGLTEAYLRR